MTGEKPWYQSKTIIGGIILIVTFILDRFTDYRLDAEGEQSLGAVISAIGETVALVMVFWGRITADKKVVIKKAEVIEPEKEDYR